MTDLKYTEFMRISLRDRVITAVGAENDNEFDNLICDLVLMNTTYERVTDDRIELCAGIKYELDCNNQYISSIFESLIKSDETRPQ